MNRGDFLNLIAAAGAARTSVTHTVVIGNSVFAPDVLKVRPGDRIKWTNRDIVPHTATATDESWDTGEIAAGESAEVAVTAGFGVAYFCRFHPMMKGLLQVG